MAGFQTDNAVIDYNTLSGLYNTLSAHADIFTAFENQALVNTTDVKGSVNSINVVSAQIVTGRFSMVSGTEQSFALAGNFSTQPVIVATVEAATGTNNAFIAQVTSSSQPSSNQGGGTTYSGVSVFVYDAINPTTAQNVIVNIIAIGQR